MRLFLNRNLSQIMKTWADLTGARFSYAPVFCPRSLASGGLRTNFPDTKN